MNHTPDFPEGATFTVVEPGWLLAGGNHYTLTVARFWTMRDDDPMYGPVAEHIKRHGLVLVDQKRMTLDDQLTDVFWYAHPTFRNAAYAEGYHDTTLSL